MRTFRVIGISLGGALIGACAALLLAPTSGERTRREIRRRAGRYIEDVRTELNDRAQDAYEHGADHARQLARTLGRKVKPVLTER
jgi:gas vesicle protein